MKFTVLGASGFIGSHLAGYLRQAGHECLTPARGDSSVADMDLGHVIYCIGLTADFRRRPFDTVQAHVCFLAEVLEKYRFESLLYLSSTRVYAGAASGDEEAQLIAGDLYNLSKLTGEAMCFASGRGNVRVARLSNVFGADFSSDNFLPSLIRAAVADGRITLGTDLDSAKDYVSIDDVVSILPKIALAGNRRVYNVANGRNTSNSEVVEKIRELTGCVLEVTGDARPVLFPPIQVARLRQEFGFSPAMLLDCLDELIVEYRRVLKGKGKK